MSGALKPKPPGTEKICGAVLWQSKGGGLCTQRPLPGRTRCKWHGGRGGWFGYQKRRRWDHLVPALKAAAARRRELGLSLPNYRKKKEEAQTAPQRGDLAAMKEKALGEIDWFEETAKELGLMPVPGTALAPLSDFTMPELLGDVGRLAFEKLRELLLKDREVRDEKGKILRPMDIRTERLEMELALGAAKLFARVSESALKTQGNDRLAEILDAIHKSNADDMLYSE